MGSVSLPRVKSSAPTLLFSQSLKQWHRGTALLACLVSFGFVSMVAKGGVAVAAAIISIIAAAALWSLRLRFGGLGWPWAASFSALLVSQIALTALQHLDAPPFIWLAALGCGLFVYALVWVSSMHEQNAGLQAIATIALLLSLGVMSKPALAMACLLVSGGLFIANRHRFGGPLGSALLFFTPTALCFTAVVVVDFLTDGAVLSHFTGSPVLKSMPDSGLPLLILIAPSLWLAFSVMLERVCEGKLGIPDFSFVLTIAFSSTAGIARWMPDRL
jgi:hypothetical protein